MSFWTILINEIVPFENIRVLIEDEWATYPSHMQERVDALWSEVVRETEAQGSAMWDGNNYSLISTERDNTELILRMGYVKYRNIATRLFPQDLLLEMRQSPEASRVRGVFVTGFVRSNDGHYVFGVRSGRHLRRDGDVTLIGGVLQPDDLVVTNIDDVFSGFLKELHEEAGILGESVTKREFLGIAQAKSNAGIVFRVDVDKSREQMLADFQRDNDMEMKNLLFVPESEVMTTLEDLGASGRDSMRIYVEFLKGKSVLGSNELPPL